MAPYARLEATLILVIGGGVTIVVAYLLGWWAVLPGVLTLALLAFYRDPPRRIPVGDNLLLAPADGRIMSIERQYRHDADSGPELRIVIFLSVFNVHINRSPCAGTVTDVTYTPGEFLNALKKEATTRNENSLMTIEPRQPLTGPVYVRQIAGVLARRVVCAAATGDVLQAGQRFGMIKLGSQTEIRVPESESWEVCVGVGDAVRGGSTVLARLAGGAADKS